MGIDRLEMHRHFPSCVAACNEALCPGLQLLEGSCSFLLLLFLLPAILPVEVQGKKERKSDVVATRETPTAPASGAKQAFLRACGCAWIIIQALKRLRFEKSNRSNQGARHLSDLKRRSTHQGQPSGLRHCRDSGQDATMDGPVGCGFLFQPRPMLWGKCRMAWWWD